MVGTLLALLVFFALFGLFLTQYVPVWMTDNESAWSAQTQASMAQLQSYIESQVVLRAPNVYATPFTMQSGSIPLIAQPTQGILTFGAAVLNTATDNPLLTYTPSDGFSLAGYGGATLGQNFPTGFVQMQLPNRYYIAQTYQLEDDAVIVSQGPNSQYIQFPPLLNMVTVGANTSVSLEVVQLGGNSTQSVFQGTQDIYTHFVNSQPVTFNQSSGFTLTISSYSHYPCAWWNFYNSTAQNSNVGGANWNTNNPSGCVSPDTTLAQTTLVIRGVTTFTYVLGELTLTAGVGST